MRVSFVEGTSRTSNNRFERSRCCNFGGPRRGVDDRDKASSFCVAQACRSTLSLDNRILRALNFKSGSWLLFNLVIAALWLRLASNLWPEPGFEGCGPDGADGITFLFLVLPLFCAGALTNFLALGVAASRHFRRLGSSWLIVLLITSVVWVGVAGYAYERNDWNPAKICTR